MTYGSGAALQLWLLMADSYYHLTWLLAAKKGTAAPGARVTAGRDADHGAGAGPQAAEPWPEPSKAKPLCMGLACAKAMKGGMEKAVRIFFFLKKNKNNEVYWGFN